ncbi:MAG TPA: hypothetical protein VFM53_15040 [Anaeromyxobacteraceae bacterium]|nr:hypothetical protein [Anaeromyxobacteraceae bacterium]
MTFRYRPLTLAPLLLVAGAALCGALALASSPAGVPAAVLLPAPAAAAGALLWLALRDEAGRLGAVVLDGSGLRRVRGDGRVVHAVRWDEVRCVLLDPRRREAVLLVPGGAVPLRGAPGPGGVGLENFGAFAAALPDYTDAPIRLPRGEATSRARSSAGGPATPSPSRPGTRSPPASR